MNPARRRESRLAFLDGSRAVAALAVVAVHVRSTVRTDESDVALPRGVLFFMDLGHYAVTVFIVISGFSLAMGWSRIAGTPGWKRKFLLRRFWRIVPTYWAPIALCVLLIATVIGTPTGTHWDTVLPLDWWGVLVHMLLLQDLVPGGPPNHVLWSIAIEWHIYFLFPLLLGLLLRRYAAIHCAVFVGVVYLLWLLGVTAWFSGLTIQYFACFALGVLAANWSTRDAATKRLWWMASGGVALSGGFVVMLYLLPVRLPAMNALADLPLAVFVAATFGLMRMGRLQSISAFLGWSPLAALGTFAYSIYLIHAPLLQIVWQYLINPFGVSQMAQFWLLAIPGATLAIAGSYVFFRVAEKPFLASRRPTLARSAAVQTASSPG